MIRERKRTRTRISDRERGWRERRGEDAVALARPRILRARPPVASGAGAASRKGAHERGAGGGRGGRAGERRRHGDPRGGEAGAVSGDRYARARRAVRRQGAGDEPEARRGEGGAAPPERTRGHGP